MVRQLWFPSILNKMYKFATFILNSPTQRPEKISMDISTLQSKILAIQQKISGLESAIMEYVALNHPKIKIQLLAENDLQLTQLQTQLTQLQEKELILLRNTMRSGFSSQFFVDLHLIVTYLKSL